MALTDPTSGAGYSFGQILPSSHMTTIANQQPYALDGNGGGSYSMGANGIVLANNDATDPTLTLSNSGAGPSLLVASSTELIGDASAIITNAHATAGVALALAASGTNGVALSVTDGAVDIADGSTFTFLGSGVPALASRSYKRVQNLHAGRDGGSARWDYSDTYLAGVRSGWLQTDITSAGTVAIPLSNLIHAQMMTSVTAHVDGATVANHGAGWPIGTMPTLYVYKVTVGTGAVSLLGSQADTSASLAAYEVVHTITVSGLTEVINEEDRYFVLLAGEAGANAVNSCLMMHSLVAAFTCTSLTPGG